MTGLTFQLNPLNGAERTFLGHGVIIVRERVLSHTDRIALTDEELALHCAETITYHYTLHCLVVSEGVTDHVAIPEEDLATEYGDGIYTLVVEGAAPSTEASPRRLSRLAQVFAFGHHS